MNHGVGDWLIYHTADLLIQYLSKYNDCKATRRQEGWCKCKQNREWLVRLNNLQNLNSETSSDYSQLCFKSRHIYVKNGQSINVIISCFNYPFYFSSQEY